MAVFFVRKPALNGKGLWIDMPRILSAIYITQKFCTCLNDLFNLFVAEGIEYDFSLPSCFDNIG